MTKNELVKILQEEGFNPDAYCLEGGFPDETYCLEETHGVWTYYYCERGLQRGKREFATESEACEYFLEKLRRDPDTRRL